MGNLFRWQVGCGCGCTCRDGLCLYRSGLYGASNITSAVTEATQQTDICVIQPPSGTPVPFYDSELSDGVELTLSYPNTAYQLGYRLPPYPQDRLVYLIKSENVSLLNSSYNPRGALIACKHSSDGLFQNDCGFVENINDCATLYYGNANITSSRTYIRSPLGGVVEATLNVTYEYLLSFTASSLNVVLDYQNAHFLGNMSVVYNAIASRLTGLIDVMSTGTTVPTPPLPDNTYRTSGFRSRMWYTPSAFPGSDAAALYVPYFRPTGYYRNGATLAMDYSDTTIPEKFSVSIEFVLESTRRPQEDFDDVLDNIISYYESWLTQFINSPVSLTYRVDCSALGIYDKYRYRNSLIYNSIPSCSST